MSFIIKAGYNIVRKDIINVTLQKTSHWNKGVIYIPGDDLISDLYPNNLNEIELARYNTGYAVLLNNTVIYDSKFPPDYEIKLTTSPEYNKTMDMYQFIDYDRIPYKYIRTFYSSFLYPIGGLC